MEGSKSTPVTDLSVRVEGDFEGKEISLYATAGEPEEYPLVQSIVSGLDTAALWTDFCAVKDRLSTSYLKDRKDNLGAPFEVVRELMIRSGFTKDSYSSLGLMKTGTTEFVDILPDYTRSVLEGLPGQVFRAHYSIAKPGWKSTFHGDSHNFRRTGFRVTLPINMSAYYAFQVDGEQFDFELQKGHAWFVNFCRIHQGLNPSNQDRVCLILQLDSDIWFKPSATI